MLMPWVTTGYLGRQSKQARQLFVQLPTVYNTVQLLLGVCQIGHAYNCTRCNVYWVIRLCRFGSLVLWISLRLPPDLICCTDGTVMLASKSAMSKLVFTCKPIKNWEIIALYLLCTFQQLLFSRRLKTTRKDRRTHTHTSRLLYCLRGSAHQGIISCTADYTAWTHNNTLLVLT